MSNIAEEKGDGKGCTDGEARVCVVGVQVVVLDLSK